MEYNGNREGNGIKAISVVKATLDFERQKFNPAESIFFTGFSLRYTFKPGAYEILIK